MQVERDEGYQTIVLESGKRYTVAGLEIPEYGVDEEGNSYIFDRKEREEIAAFLIKEAVEYKEKLPIIGDQLNG